MHGVTSRQGYQKALVLLSKDVAVEMENVSNTLRCPVKCHTVGGVAATATEADWSVDDEIKVDQ